VAGDRLVEDVLLELLDLGVRHAPVVDRAGALVGVVSDVDLLAGGPLAPFAARRRIERAPDRESVLAAAAGIRETALALHDARVDAGRVGEVLAALLDALTRRLIELAQADLGTPPAPFAWYVLGSQGRREVSLASDQDSALAWEGGDDDPQLRSYFLALAARVVEDMARAGVPRCSAGATADRPLFARSVAAWVGGIRELPSAPQEEHATILLAVLTDARPVTPHDPGGTAIGAALRDPAMRPVIERRLAMMALAHRPPTGFVRDLVVEHSGDQAGKLDLKRGGLLPIVDLARALALRAGERPLSTRARLEAARDAGVLVPGDVAVLEAAFELLLDLRLAHQVRQVRAGEPPDDFLAPSSLDALTRAFLRDAFRAVARVQRGIAADLRLRVP
jgi:CBS domain-containing protein